MRVEDEEAAEQAGEADQTEPINVTVYDIVAAAMSGLAGSRILTNEVEKKYLRAAAETALTRDSADPDNPAMASTIRHARPVDVFKTRLIRPCGTCWSDSVGKRLATAI